MGYSDPLLPEEVGSDDPSRKISDLCALLADYSEPKQVQRV